MACAMCKASNKAGRGVPCNVCAERDMRADNPTATGTPRRIGCGKYTDPMRLNDDGQCPGCQP